MHGMYNAVFSRLTRINAHLNTLGSNIDFRKHRVKLVQMCHVI